MSIQNFYYLCGGIVSSCTLLGIIMLIFNKIYYSRTKGEVLESKFDSIEKLLIELVAQK
ncbi:hypothetical protein ES702_04955 [subsurface metagenome]